MLCDAGWIPAAVTRGTCSAERATDGNLADDSRSTDTCNLDKRTPGGLIQGNCVTFCVQRYEKGRSDK